MKKVAIIGAGLQANRRAPAILDGQHEVAWVVDRNFDRANKLAQQFGGQASTDWRMAINDPKVSIVLVLTYPDSHAEIAKAAFENGKHVLAEKPLTRTEDEARSMIASAEKNKKVLRCGFNHRFHPAVREALRIYRAGEIGKAIFGRGRYGIAGRAGVEKEWRSNPEIVSGGQLMEQGIHLVDLFRLFLGDFSQATGMTATSHWPIAPLEDNGFALMKTKSGAIVSLHSSLTQWINLFEFEIYGEMGSLTVQGLGASYGVEKLIFSKHDPTGPFSHQTIEYRGGDLSWKDEWKSFTQAIKQSEEGVIISDGSIEGGTGEDGLRSMEIIRAVYQAAQSGQRVNLVYS